MKKILLIPAAVGILAFGGIALANTDSFNDPSTKNDKSQQTDKQDSSTKDKDSGDFIGFEKATSIALAISEGKVVDIELGEDDGVQQYEIEIQDNKYEYDFEIDALTGKVLEEDRDRLDEEDDNDGTAVTMKDLISADEASDIALKESDGGTIVEFELENDDAIQHYDIEILNDNKKFEYNIHAVDGTVLKLEQNDNDNDKDDDDDDEQDND